jgi:hypothetical protein
MFDGLGGGPVSEWLKVGQWIINTNAVSGVHYDGEKAEIFLGGGITRTFHGGFSSTGAEAKAIWEWWVAKSVDPTEPLHKRVKA